MKTILLYLSNAYQKTASAAIEEVVQEGNETALILDQTIFYAQGGGQPADIGIIKGKNGTFQVTHVSYNGGAVLHKGKLEGSFEQGDEVTLEIDWELRYQHMQMHTAGHILDQAVKNVMPGNMGVDGDHGIGKRCFVEFEGMVEADQLPAIQEQIDAIIQEDAPITFEMMTYDQIIDSGITLPFELPKNKELRIVQIGEYPAMPDGGTQLKSTGESWPIQVIDVREKEGKYRIVYQVMNPSQADEISYSVEVVPSSNSLSLTALQEKIDEILSTLQSDLSRSDINLQTKYLGKKGLFNDLAQMIRDVDGSDKKEAGQLLNQLKEELETKISKQATATISAKARIKLDLTMPGIKPKVGHMHPISQAMEEIVRIFQKIGFTIVRYPEVDWDWYAFESLNMPPNHPARDEWETFFVDVPDTTQPIAYDPDNPRQRHPSVAGGKILLTPQTSNGQVREMERLGKPPIRMINIARCYRRQQDVTHTQMFHQFEGLVVDKGINIQHLKGTLDYFAQEFYGPGTKSRIRPFHFQFTEPSFEVDFSCHICGGTGKIKDEKGEATKCRFCKSGWHEVGGAGMVHPNVLKAGGIDPEQYTGFAFGWGIERTYTLKEGLNIDDIRLLYSGDLRFLEQF